MTDKLIAGEKQRLVLYRPHGRNNNILEVASYGLDIRKIEGKSILESLLDAIYARAGHSRCYGLVLEDMREYRTKQKYIYDIFVLTTDNQIICYSVNARKRGAVRVMTRRSVDTTKPFVYIGYGSTGCAYIIDDNAVSVFNGLIKIDSGTMTICKISTEYALPADYQFAGINLGGGIYDAEREEEINARLIEAAKDKETFYKECMKYVPMEMSEVDRTGRVLTSTWMLGNQYQKNEHMFKQDGWHEIMTTFERPHFWDFDVYSLFHDVPEELVDCDGNPFGTVEEL